MRLSVFAAAGLLALALCAPGATGQAPPAEAFDAHPGVELRRFSSAEEFERYVASRRPRDLEYSLSGEPMNETAVYSTDAPADMEPSAFAAVPDNPSITNNQTAGVDEGGIVKQIGRFLVVLQDGRLFSADLGAGEGGPLRLVDRIDVYRSRESAADWYDEMLVHGDRILVTAYNYGEGASEISVLRIDSAGRLRREGRFLLSSNDYYSTENYSSRLVGDSLVFYAPVALEARPQGQAFAFPRIRRALGDGAADEGEPLVGPTDIYAPPGEIEWPVIHTVSVCPLRGEELDCRTTAFVGASNREIYVSPTDAFLWMDAPDGLPWSIEYGNLRRRTCPADQIELPAGDRHALLYRVPLDGSAIGAVAVDGYPADQFAFDSRDGRIRILLSQRGDDCTNDARRRPLALVDLPLDAFGTRLRRLAAGAYRPLPPIDGAQLENRFIGDWLVYGGRASWNSEPIQRDSRPGLSSLFAIPLRGGVGPVRLALPHNTLRIERAGDDAVVTGYAGPAGLSLSYIALGDAPRLAATTTLDGRFESEARSHAFSAWRRSDGSGLIGLPTSRRRYRAGRGWSDSTSSELSYIAVGSLLTLTPVGELTTRRAEPHAGYRCVVSCVDWYGNSRPIFTGGRIFALMGTELVEGRLASGSIAEIGRLDLTGPPAAR